MLSCYRTGRRSLFVDLVGLLGLAIFLILFVGSTATCVRDAGLRPTNSAAATTTRTSTP